MFGYVILHYQNIDVTKKCVDSLVKITNKEPIIIVDNYSPNNSGITLKKIYSNFNRIKVIINNKNEGFAKGNNYGFNYLRENYDVDYIVVMNNDIIIDNENFSKIIEKFMVDNNIDVCGPDMVTIKGNHQNPLALVSNTSLYLRKRIIQDKIKCFLLNFTLFWKIYIKYKSFNVVQIRDKQEKSFQCILHGSCIIYGHRYIQEERFAFVPITYMYNEEAILFDYLMYKGYRTGYCPNVTILHMEGISTGSIIKNERKKILYRFKNNTKSLELQLIERKKYIKKGKIYDKD